MTIWKRHESGHDQLKKNDGMGIKMLQFQGVFVKARNDIAPINGFDKQIQKKIKATFQLKKKII